MDFIKVLESILWIGLLTLISTCSASKDATVVQLTPIKSVAGQMPETIALILALQNSTEIKLTIARASHADDNMTDPDISYVEDDGNSFKVKMYAYYMDDPYQSLFLLSMTEDLETGDTSYDFTGHFYLNNEIMYVNAKLDGKLEPLPDTKTQDSEEENAREPFSSSQQPDHSVKPEKKGSQDKGRPQRPPRTSKVQGTLLDYFNDESDEKDDVKTSYSEIHPAYFLDIAVVVDRKRYSAFLKRHKNNDTAAEEAVYRYYAFLFAEVNSIYTFMKMPWTLELRIVKIYILKSEINASFIDIHKKGEYLDMIKCAVAFRNKLIEDSQNSYLVFGRHDLYILFTGYDLSREHTGYVVGKGYIGMYSKDNLCRKDGYSYMIMEEQSDFERVFTLCQFFAFSFGVPVDGDKNMCNGLDNYMMARPPPVLSGRNKYNRWHFSTCSKSAYNLRMNDFLKTDLGGVCLPKKMVVAPEVPNVTGILVGSLMTVDEQCQLRNGPLSSQCSQFLYPDVCNTMRCKKKNSQICESLWALSGTPCGPNKICIFGRCFPKNAIESEKCVADSTDFKMYNNMNCESLIKSSNTFCYDENIRRTCCKSCDLINRNIKGCEWGDRYAYCPNTKECVPGQHTKWVIQSCCESCRRYSFNICKGREQTDIEPAFCTDKSACFFKQIYCCKYCSAFDFIRSTSGNKALSMGYRSQRSMLFLLLFNLAAYVR